MLEKYYIDIKNLTDLNIYRFGIEDCYPDYHWGPALRDHYIIHYVFSGRGELMINDKLYSLSEGQGFLIPPETIVSYKADHENPWSYCWVGFNGIKAEYYVAKLGLSGHRPVFECSENQLPDIVKSMLDTKNIKRGRELKLLSYLYMFLFELNDKTQTDEATAETQTNKEEYLKGAIEYIAKNYSMPISVQEISNHIGIDRSYLYILFKEFLNTSPSDYLINYRINISRELLKNKTLSIGEISRSVGYNDQFVFSKVFKKITGLSPQKSRAKN